VISVRYWCSVFLPKPGEGCPLLLISQSVSCLYENSKPGQSYLLKIEEDSIETEEHESDTGNKPVESRVLKCRSVNPLLDRQPFCPIIFVEGMFGVWDRAHPCKKCSAANQSSNSASGFDKAE
jgi:hypothetical protein